MENYNPQEMARYRGPFFVSLSDWLTGSPGPGPLNTELFIVALILSAVFGFLLGCLCVYATRRYNAFRRTNNINAANKPRVSIRIQEEYGLQELHRRNRSHDSIPGDIWPQRVLIVTNPDRSSKIGDSPSRAIS